MVRPPVPLPLDSDEISPAPRRFAPIDTERLTLRALREDDLDRVFEILSDEATTANVSWRQSTREKAHAWLHRRIVDEQRHGISMWGVDHRELRRLVGLCGFFPRGEPQLELGYVILARFWGNGLASEAVEAAVAAVAVAGIPIYATIRPSNAASLRVAEKAGLSRDGRLQDERGDLIIVRG